MLGTMIARPEVHSATSGCLPGLKISTRPTPSGIEIGTPLEMKSTQCGAGATFAPGAAAGARDGGSCQQKRVFIASAANAGIENSEMNDFSAAELLGSATGAVTNEIR